MAYLHDQVAIKQILTHLGLSPPGEPKPPPAGHEVVSVLVDEEGREIAVLGSLPNAARPHEAHAYDD